MSKQNETREQLNTRVLTTVRPVEHVISSMRARMTKPWPKLAGVEPTDAELMAAAMFSKQTAGCEAGFMAMQLRAEGCSILQLGQAFNCGPAHNHSRDHSGRVWHHFNRGKLGPGVFTLTFTQAGETQLASQLVKAGALPAKAPAKGPSKPKGKSKAPKATRVAPPETPTSEAPSLTVTVDENQASEPDGVYTGEALRDIQAQIAEQLGGVEPEHDEVAPGEALRDICRIINN